MAVQTPTTHEERLDSGTIAVRVAPDTYEPGTRSFEVTMSSGAAVRRYSWYTGRMYEERLSFDPDHLDLERANSGNAPFLSNHNSYSLDSVIGSLVAGSVRVEGGQLVGRVRMHETERAVELAKRVERGELTNVSIGYQTKEQLRTFEEQDEGDPLEVRTAVNWEILELSLVTIPADAKSNTRDKPDGAVCTVETQSSETRANMAPKDETQKADTEAQGARAADPAPKPADESTQARSETTTVAAPEVDTKAVAAAAELAERKRAADITAAVRSVNLPAKFGESLVARGISLADANAEIVEELANTRDVSIDGHVSVELDERSKVAAATERAILHRADPRRYPLEDGDDARAMVGETLLELGCRHLDRQGIKLTGLGRVERAAVVIGNTRLGGGHSPSDFPLILANTTGRVLRDGYAAAPKSFEALVTERPVTDFKPITALRLTDATALSPVADSGEYSYGTIDEAGETYRLGKFGKIIALTRETLLNDDLSAIAMIPLRLGQQASRLESTLFWGVVTDNGNMADGNPLFHANHGNLGSGAISTAAIGALDTAMGLQTDTNGTELDIKSRFLVVPRTKKVLAQQTVGIVFAATAQAETSPYRDELDVIASPFLDGSSADEWYLFASPMEIDTIEMAYLAGQREPYIETKDGFDIDGVKIKIRHERAFKAIDWRGIAKSTGV